MDEIVRRIQEKLLQRGNAERQRAEEWQRSLKPTVYLGKNLFQELGGEPLEGRYLGQVGLVPGQSVPNIGRNPNKPVIPGLPLPVPPVEVEEVYLKVIVNFPDFIVIRYAFSDGSDLDTRTSLFSQGSGYIGWAQGSSVGNILTWGGDNTGTGVESVLFDTQEFVAAYNTNTVTLDLRGQWYGTVGTSVTIEIDSYFGGAMVKSGFTWINPTAESTSSFDSYSTPFTFYSRNGSSIGERITFVTLFLSSNTISYS